MEDASPLARLAAALTAAAGAEGPTPRELAELLWLAEHLAPASEAVTEETARPREGDTAAPAAQADAEVVPPRHGSEPLPSPDRAPAATRHDGRVPLLLPTAPAQSAATHGGGTPLLAPAPPMLHHPLELQRALRPLKRRVPSPRTRVLDERATADRIARLGAHPDVWLPVLRPAPDRWLRLNLVHDTGPTMPVWRPLVRELHTALAQSGIFRTISLHPATPDGRARHVPALDDGRTVTLVVSDCMGPQWRPGEAGTRWYGTLHRWADRMPLAVVQPLPERLWAMTALPADPGQLTAPAAAAPSRALAFTPYDPEASPPPASAVPLPVLEPGAPWLANWAALLADPGGGRSPGAAAWLPEAPRPLTEPAPDIASLSPEDLVLHFRATASPEAFRLAGHLALAVPSVPVMRLVQRTVDRDPRPQHLAEVILSGMLTAVPGPNDSYEFRPGVRELLLRSLPRTARGRTREFLAQVGGLIDERAGLAAGEFRAEAGGGGTSGGGTAFATVSEETVRRLGAGESSALVGGRYRLVGRRGPGRRMWEAVDERTDERVVVHLYPEQGADHRERFLVQARVLAEVDSPHVVRVRDFGVDGETPYLVAEFVDGVTLAELIDGSGPGVSFQVLAHVVCHGLAGLNALHSRGLVRGQNGQNGADGLLLRPDGTLVISRFALGEQSVGRSEESDVGEFDLLVRELLETVKAPVEFRRMLTRIRHAPPLEVTKYAAQLLAEVTWPGPLRFAMLGSLQISDDTGPLPVPSPEAQALLCMLLLRPGRRVTHPELVQGMWEEPPPSREARRRIRHLAAQVAQHLGPGTVALLSDGLALYADRAHIDVLRCEEFAVLGLTEQALDLFHGDPLDGVPGPAAEEARTRLRALREELVRRQAESDGATAPTRRPRPSILFEADNLTDRPEARITLEYAVHEMLSRGDLTPQHYEVRVRDDGYLVLTDPDAYLLPVLVAVLRGIPELLADLADRPRMSVTFRHPDVSGTPPGIPAVRGDVLVVPPALYDQFAASSAARGSRRFHPLYDSATAPSPLAWYCPLSTSEPEPRDLLRGPFITQDLHELGIPAPGRTAVVHTLPDGPLTLLNPARPYGGRPPRPATYYEVDLIPHQSRHEVSLPSSGKGDFTAAVELSWHVDDPVAFVRGETIRVAERLLDHLLDAAARITRHHSLRRATGAERAVNAGLRSWPVPGLSVTCAVRLAPEWAVPPTPRHSPSSPRPLSDVLAGADTVLLGFDGPLTRLFSAKTARAATLDLLSVVVEHRHPDDALAGRPLPAVAGTGREVFTHPLDLLRAFAHDRLGPLLRDRLDHLELQAVPDAPTTHHSVPLVRTLHGSGHPVHVVTDVCEQAVRRYLEPYRLPLAGVHGRGEDLGRLLPHPDCLLRALGPSGGQAPTGVLIGSSVAELTAAQQVGLRFVGLARNPTAEQRLREAGCELTVSSLAPVLEAARSL